MSPSQPKYINELGAGVLSLMLGFFLLLMTMVMGCATSQFSEIARARALVAVAEGEALGDVNPFPGNLPLLDPDDAGADQLPHPGPPPMPDDGPEVFRSERTANPQNESESPASQPDALRNSDTFQEDLLEKLELLEDRLAVLEAQLLDRPEGAAHNPLCQCDPCLCDPCVCGQEPQPMTLEQGLELVAKHQKQIIDFWAEQEEAVTLLEAAQLWRDQQQTSNRAGGEKAAESGLPVAEPAESPPARGSAEVQEPITEIQWVSPQEAIDSPLPVMVYFTLPDGQCPHCIVLEREVLSHPAVLAASRQRACVKISEATHPWAVRYANGWPTLAFWNEQGVEGRLTGSNTTVEQAVNLLQGD